MRPSHIIILIVVLVLIFGARKLPDIARSIGQSLKIFKKEVSELQEPPAITPAQPTAVANAALPVTPVTATPVAPLPPVATAEVVAPAEPAGGFQLGAPPQEPPAV